MRFLYFLKNKTKKRTLIFANFWLRSRSRPQPQHFAVEALQSRALTGPFQPDSHALVPVCSRIYVGSVSIPPFPEGNVTRVFSPDSWRRTSTHTRVRCFRFTLSLHLLLFFFYKYVNKTQTAYGVAGCFFLNMCLLFHSDMYRSEERLMPPGGGGGCVAA